MFDEGGVKEHNLDLSGSGGVDMLSRPVAATRAAVATGASGSIGTHVSDAWKCGKIKLYFHLSAGGFEKKKLR